MDIKRFILNKWFFPEIVKIDVPGILINRVVKKYGKTDSQNRMVYIFEDVLVDLFLRTQKKLGEKKANEIWYRIGKNSIISYFLISGAKKQNRVLVKNILKYIFERFLITGVSLGSNVSYENEVLFLKGKNNVIQRKSMNGEVFAGMISAVLSFLLGENIEAKSKSYEEKGEIYCEVVAHKKIEKRYEVSLKNFENFVKIVKSVMPRESLQHILRDYKNYSTISEMIRFGNIKIVDNISYFNSEALLSGEINSGHFFITEYERVGEKDFAKKSIVDSSEDILKRYFYGKNVSISEKRKYVENMMSALGWGIAVFRKNDNQIIYDFVYGASCEVETFHFYALHLQGFLKEIYGREIKIKRIKRIKNRRPISRVVFEF